MKKTKLVYEAEVTQVIDGDTIRVDIDLGLGTFVRNEKIRFFGINCPELRGPEAADGMVAKEYVKHRIPPGSKITIETFKDRREKYGRYLAVIYLEDGTDLNLELVAKGIARKGM